MGRVTKLILFVTFLFSFYENSLGRSLVETYENKFLLGEKNPGNYEGIVAPDFRTRKIDGGLEFLDEVFKNNFLDSNGLSPVSTLLKHWYFDDLPTQRSCPNSSLIKHYDYIQYLFRLTTISYLYESMKSYHETLYKIGASTKSCNLNTKELFRSCRPRSREMKKFVSRVRGAKSKFVNFNNYKKFTSKELNSWLSNLSSLQSNDVSVFRLSQELDLKEGPQKESVKTVLSKSCKDSYNLINEICNETDRLYGMSHINEARLLIFQSHTFKLINRDGSGNACLRRFNRISSRNEKRYPILENLFPIVMNKVLNEKQPYLQGALFIPGSLKEFDDKGLKDFIFVAKNEEKKEVVKVKQETKPKKVVVEKTPSKIKRPEVKKVTNNKPKKAKASEFEKAVAQRLKRKLDKFPVNMEKMQKEKVFTDAMIVALTGPLKFYQTQKSLKEMKKFDSLGQKKEPMRLLFIRFLIDNHIHQGLYNINTVLGDRFWVVNDIEKKKVPHFIELVNGPETNHQWQIFILKPPVM